MSLTPYLAGVQALFDGEVMGERLLLALYAAAKSSRDAWHFAHLLQLETETKARLRPLMLKHGLSLAETADLSTVPGRVADYVAQSWSDYATASATRLGAVLTRYEAIAALGPIDDQAILQAVVRHESALLAWALAEAAGGAGNSLAEVVALLNFPLTRPV